MKPLTCFCFHQLKFQVRLYCFLLQSWAFNKRIFMYKSTLRWALTNSKSLKLQSWTKVLGQIYICGAFSNSPNKQSHANSSTLGQPLPPQSPPPHLQCWTRVHVIFPVLRHCMGGGGGVKQRNLKRITVLF